MTPAEELRAAAVTERNEWDDTISRRVWPKATMIHFALIELLDHIADDMEDRGAIEFQHQWGEGSVYVDVHPQPSVYISEDCRLDWTAALALARAINAGESE